MLYWILFSFFSSFTTNFASVLDTHKFALPYVLHTLCRSEMYRSIKLFLVGKGLRGKSTLLRRLCNLADQKTERTVGIEIVNFSYVPHTRSVIFGRSKHGKEPVKFLVWDFAGQVRIYNVCRCMYMHMGDFHFYI